MAMDGFELAKQNNPAYWSKKKLQTLVKYGKLTKEQYQELTKEKYVSDVLK